VFAWGGPVLGWVKLGSDINGDEEYGYFGKAVALSGDGTTVAVGAEGVGRAGDHATDDYFGEVRMLRWSGTNWVQLGSRIRGDVPDDYFGSRLVLSNNGNTAAIGAQHRVTHTNDHPDNNRGYVKVFDFTSGVWVQRGSTLWGDGRLDYAYKPSLSADGNVLANGATETGDNGQLYAGRGYVRVFDWVPGNAWVQRGTHIYGVAVLDQFGFAVSLSASGDTVAVGAPMASHGGINEAGHVRVFDCDSSTNSWLQRGAHIIDIDSATAGDRLGYSVSLTDDGNAVAVGSPANVAGGDAGLALVHVWDGTVGTSGAWVRRGSAISGSVAGDQSGHVISLSATGGVVAITAPIHQLTGATWGERGQTRVYGFCQCQHLPEVCTGVDAWVPRGLAIEGEGEDDRSGWSGMSLSSRGDVLAIGA